MDQLDKIRRHYGDVSDEKLIQMVITDGNLDYLKVIHENIITRFLTGDPYDGIHTAVDNSHIHIIKYYLAKNIKLVKYVFVRACNVNNVRVAKFILSIYGDEIVDEVHDPNGLIIALLDSQKNNNNDILEFLFQIFIDYDLEPDYGKYTNYTNYTNNPYNIDIFSISNGIISHQFNKSICYIIDGIEYYNVFMKLFKKYIILDLYILDNVKFIWNFRDTSHMEYIIEQIPELVNIDLTEYSDVMEYIQFLTDIGFDYTYLYSDSIYKKPVRTQQLEKMIITCLPKDLIGDIKKYY